MNVHASALAEAHLPDEQTSTFAREAIGDLSQRPKRLSPKYFYDATGSELFEAITRLPEYYLTRADSALLDHPGYGTVVSFFNQDARHIGRDAEADIDGITIPQFLSNATCHRLADAKRRRLEGRQWAEDFA